MYFSDCQAGAAPGCVPGDNAQAGTSATSPKRTLAGVDVNSLPAGSRLLFARGGAWTGFNLNGIRNLNVTPAAPLVLDAYTPVSGASAAPWLKTGTGNAIDFGVYLDTTQDGGYTLRNLKLDGQGSATWGIWLKNEVRSVTIENLEITGFEIGIHAQSDGTLGLSDLSITGSTVHGNRGMGMLGTADNLTLRGNTFRANNASGSTLNHAVYLGSSGRVSRNVTVADNVFADNSVVGGVCTGGNFTVHGQYDGLLVENNRITQAASTGGCWGISITPAYGTAEAFRNVVVRSNLIERLGTAIGVGSAPGVVIDGNRIKGSSAASIAVPAIPPGAGDAADGGGSIRNNVFCGVANPAIYQPNAGDAVQLNNIVTTLAACLF